METHIYRKLNWANVEVLENENRWKNYAADYTTKGFMMSGRADKLWVLWTYK